MLLRKLEYYALLLLVVTIPISRLFNLNSYAIALFSGLVLLSLRNRKAIVPNKWSILFFLYYLVLVVNLLFIDQPKVLPTMIKYLPLALIPFVLQYVKYKKRVLDTFLYSIVISCVVCIVYTYIKSQGYIFYYHEPTEILDIQLNYLSVFVCFALGIIYNEILETNVTKLKHYLFVPILFFSLAVFYNRAGILISIIITLLFLIINFIKFKNLKFLAIFIVLFGSATLWMLSRPIVQSKFEKLLNADYDHSTNYDNGVSSRMLSWKCSLQLIESTGVFGHGINNTTALLTNCYNNKVGDESIPSLKEYNAHNQFLQTAVSLGFLGTVILLLIYAYILIVGFRHKDYLVLFYFIIILIFGITESFLIRQWGLIFFVFFTPFLLNRYSTASLNPSNDNKSKN